MKIKIKSYSHRSAMENILLPANLSGADSGIDSACIRTNSSQQNIPNNTDSDATSAIYTIDTNQESNPLDDLTDIDQPLSDNHPQLSHQLSDCSSTFEFVDVLSLADGGRSNSSTLNEQESIIDELNHQPASHVEPIIRFTDLIETNPPDDNNKMFRRQLCDRGRLSSKEEKQRQNEEIVILESSSVSSESGSWEPVFPQRTPSAVNIPNAATTSVVSVNQHIATQPVVVPSKTPEQPEMTFIPNQSTSSRGACFIDASSLLDDTEVTFSSLNCTNVCEPNNKLLDDLREDSHEKDQTELCKESEMGKMDLDLMSTEQHVEVADLQSPNLSDEQKLYHRGSEHRIDYDIKDQFASDSYVNQKIFTDDCQGTDSTSMTTKDGNSIVDEFEADYLVRQEQERKQGNFLFKNSIQHYSSQMIPPNILHSDREESDMSLPSIYSTNSEPCNDLGQNYETSSQYSSNFGDTNEYGHAYSRCLSETESGFYPDTPHNSIVNVDSPRCFSRSDPERAIKIPKKPFKCDESAPIVSGGASIQDFTPKLCESPSVRRKTDTCPILSGGLVMSDFEDDTKPKVVDKPKVTPRNAWVVDMSDCKSKRSGSSSSSTTDVGSNRSTDTPIERSGSASSHKSGLGFYVSLNDMKSKKVDSMEKSISRNGTHDMKKSSGFYVDLSENEHSRSSTPPVNQAQQQSTEESDKKNIFSMFIDFGVKKVVAKKEPSSFTSRLTRAIQKQNEESQSDTESNPKASDSDKEDHTVARRSCSPGKFKNDTKRHSWNTTKEKSTENPKSYTRSSSLCNDNGIMSILDKIPFISKTSSMSIDSPHSPYDEFTCSKSLSSYSNNSNSLTSNSIHSSVECKNRTEVPDIMATSTRKRQKDAKINETFDKSSQGSLTDGILSKDSSPTTDTDDVTFQNDEPVVRNHLMETIVETKETNSPKKVPTHKPTAEEIHAMETLQATIEKQKLLLETVNEEVQLSSFVKLSDMDKPGPKFELHGENLSKSVGSSRIGRLFIDGKTTNRNTWQTMSRSQG